LPRSPDVAILGCFVALQMMRDTATDEDNNFTAFFVIYPVARSLKLTSVVRMLTVLLYCLLWSVAAAQSSSRSKRTKSKIAPPPSCTLQSWCLPINCWCVCVCVCGLWHNAEAGVVCRLWETSLMRVRTLQDNTVHCLVISCSGCDTRSRHWDSTFVCLLVQPCTVSFSRSMVFEYQFTKGLVACSEQLSITNMRQFYVHLNFVQGSNCTIR